jgi:hypothetical protein
MAAEGKKTQIAFVGTHREIDGALWQQCFPAPLEGRFWYDTLESCGLEDQFEFRYAVIKREGRAVGIAPCFTYNVPIALVAPPPVVFCLNLLSKVFPRAGYQRTLFVGSPCSDEGTIGLVPGVDLAEVARELAASVRAEARRLKAPMIVFKDFPPAALAGLRALCRADGFFAIASYPGTVVPLPAPDKPAWLRSLTQTARHNLLKKLRRSQELLALETTVVERPSDRELEEIHALFLQTYEKGRTKLEKLNPRFFQAMRGHEPARFILQRDRASGELAAFMLVFRLGDRVINKFIGLDYGRGPKAFLYFRLFDAAVDYAYANGAKELQSGQTGYRAKFDLGHRLVPLFNVVRHQNPLVNALFRAIGTRTTWQSLDPDLATYLRAHPEYGNGKPG